MKQNTKKYRVLLLLSKGKTQAEIVRSIGMNKVIISRYAKEFLDKKWIKCVDPNAYCKMYRATPEAPITQREKKVNLLRSGRKTRVHNLCWKYKLLEQPRRKVTWDKTIKLKNGVTQKLIYFPLYTISLYLPSNTILIWVKEEYTDNIDKWDQTAQEHMLQAQAFLQKMLLCSISLPEVSQDPHFAKPIENPEVMNVLKRQGMMRMGEVWIDASKPGFEYGEIESTDINKLKTMEKLQWADLNIPDRINKIEEILDKTTENLGRMAELQQDTTFTIDSIDRRVMRIEKPKHKEDESNTDLNMYG